MEVSIRSYFGDSASAQAHAQEVTVGQLTLWFSYQTVVGFEHPSTGRVVSENLWSTTTGKHLGVIEKNKKKRVSRMEFQDRLKVVLEKLTWIEEVK